MIALLKLLKKSIITNSEHVRKKTDELLWAQTFNSTIVHSSWLKNQSFSPGRWAVGYPLLYLLYRIYNDIKPKQILEFGLGESTKLLYQYAAAYDCEYTVVEHDQEWIIFFVQDKPIEHNNILKTPISTTEYKGKSTTVYNELIANISHKKYDFINIDGPFGSPEYSRTQIIDIVNTDLLQEDFIILMDDYNRMGEQNTICDLKKALTQKDKTFTEAVYSGEKDFIIICSPKYRFLCSL